MRKPVIGIAGKPVMPKENDYWHRIEMVDDIRYLLVSHDALAVMLLPSEKTMKFNDNDLGDDTALSAEDLQGLYQQLELIDGLILQGGDVSCQFEVELARKAIEQDKPVLGICAGFNNILRALGSNTFEDKTASHSHYDINYRHQITVENDSLLYQFTQSEYYQVNSFHTMVATDCQVTPFARASSHSAEGYVESLELPDRSFVLGVKWHPEQMKDEPATKRMITAFLDACRSQMNK